MYCYRDLRIEGKRGGVWRKETETREEEDDREKKGYTIEQRSALQRGGGLVGWRE